MKRVLFATIIVLTGLFPACDDDMVYDHFETLPEGTWKWTDPREFKLQVEDTLSNHRIYVQLRHGTDYPYRNLYMFVHVKGPDGQNICDTVNIELAAADGRWIGKGSGKHRELRLLYRRQTRFAQAGPYVFTLEQGMRKPALPVTDIGIRIERENP
ncbi:MAG: hypothetical protein CSA96_00040 [Bacteroidetes bacterium]|nr:MAG: hypothetical protein CSA96_00040 [Bacteroidota bacterium]